MGGGDGLKRNTRNLGAVMNVFLIWVAVMVSWVYTVSKLIKLCALNMCGLLNVNYNSIELFVKKKKKGMESGFCEN